MNNTSKESFRIIMILGLIIAFCACFLDWYNVLAFDSNGQIIFDWTYALFTFWSSSLDNNLFPLNELYQPDTSIIPLEVVIIFLGLLLLSGIVVFIKQPEQQSRLGSLQGASYINIGTLMLIGLMLGILPFQVLFPNEYYFPYLVLYEYELEITWYYSIGWGYLLLILAFILMFPYTVFYYTTVSSFEKANHTEITPSFAEELDLDKEIAEESQKVDNEAFNPEEVEVELIYRQLKERQQYGEHP